jgi:hypothetical protein
MGVAFWHEFLKWTLASRVALGLRVMGQMSRFGPLDIMATWHYVSYKKQCPFRTLQKDSS